MHLGRKFAEIRSLDSEATSQLPSPTCLDRCERLRGPLQAGQSVTSQFVKPAGFGEFEPKRLRIERLRFENLRRLGPFLAHLQGVIPAVQMQQRFGPRCPDLESNLWACDGLKNGGGSGVG